LVVLHVWWGRVCWCVGLSDGGGGCGLVAWLFVSGCVLWCFYMFCVWLVVWFVFWVFGCFVVLGLCLWFFVFLPGLCLGVDVGVIWLLVLFGFVVGVVCLLFVCFWDIWFGRSWVFFGRFFGFGVGFVWLMVYGGGFVVWVLGCLGVVWLGLFSLVFL